MPEGIVRMKGLEPPRLSAPDPKSGAATNYATSAYWPDKLRCKYTAFSRTEQWPAFCLLNNQKSNKKPPHFGAAFY